jgi:hypothetical protein
MIGKLNIPAAQEYMGKTSSLAILVAQSFLK